MFPDPFLPRVAVTVGKGSGYARLHKTSDVLEHKWRASLKTILFLWMILTSNTEATENKVEFLNYCIHGKGISVP